MIVVNYYSCLPSVTKCLFAFKYKQKAVNPETLGISLCSFVTVSETSVISNVVKKWEFFSSFILLDLSWFSSKTFPVLSNAKCSVFDLPCVQIL